MRDYLTVRAQKREEPAPDVRVLLRIRTLGKSKDRGLTEGQTMHLYERKAVRILSLPISSKSLPKHKSLKAKKQRFLILWDSCNHDS
jgi:hypothetical protein